MKAVKIYFTKYLTLPDKIKVDDIVYFRNQFYKARLKKDTKDHILLVPQTGKKTTIYHLNDVKEKALKVDLFLCTSFPDPGNLVFCQDEMDYPKEAWLILEEGDECKADLEVVGRISSEATWVKEGDELKFEEFSVVDNIVKVKCPHCKSYL